ncbi:PAS sensor protein, partial [Streptomyces sp. SID6648]|nr:PAS sensor protein [Streptomyces sp. SID6648]
MRVVTSRWADDAEEPGHDDADAVPGPAGPDFPRAVLRALGAGVLTLGPTARITSVNPWAEHLLGRTEREMLGHDAHD